MTSRLTYLWAWAWSCEAPTSPAPPGDSDTSELPDSDTGLLTPLPEWEDHRVTLGQVITCPDPTARDALGPYSRTEYGTDWWLDDPGILGGKGVNVEDFDGDGHLDFFVPQSGGASKMLAGDGAGGFTNVTDTVFPAPLNDIAGAATADLDADGDVDIVAYGFKVRLQLLRNDGAGVFSVEELPSPMLGCGGTASLADMDLDGDLDLFHGGLNGAIDGETCRSFLFENIGGGTLVDVTTERVPDEVHDLKVMASGWLQLDADPLLELYVVTDLPASNDGNLALDNVTAGGPLVTMSLTGLEVDLAGMGLGIGDLNDDGVWDVVVPAIKKIAVLVSLPETGLWIDQSAVYGIVPDVEDNQTWGWGAEVDDLDNDGFADVAVGFGPTRKPDQEPQPDEIYRNKGDGTFERVAELWGAADTLSMRGFVFTDFDRDGWLDIVKRELAGRIVVYQSHCGPEHWIEVALEGVGENLDGIGATVQVDIDGVTQMRPIVAGSTGYNNSGPPVAHFGLGAAVGVDSIEITWPDGEVTHHPPQAANQRLTIRYAPDGETIPTVR